MRKKLKWTIALFLVSIIGFLAYEFIDSFQKKEAHLKTLDKLPTFSLVNTKEKLISETDIAEGHWTVFIFFNTECHYCQEEAKQLSGLRSAFENVSFLFVSSEPLKDIIDFQQTYQLLDNNSIMFLQDSEAVFSKKMGITTTPQFLIYTPEKKLIQNHKGAWRIDKLLKKIEYGFKAP